MTEQQLTIYCSECGCIIPIECLRQCQIRNYKIGFRVHCKDCLFTFRMRKGYVPCSYCGKICYPTRDHVLPKSRGGKKTIPACSACNLSKGSLSLLEWIEKLPSSAPQRYYVPQIIYRLQET